MRYVDSVPPICVSRWCMIYLHICNHYLPAAFPLQLFSTSHKHCNQLDWMVTLQASHCCLVAHTTLLLCLCEAFSHLQQLKKAPAIHTLPVCVCVCVCVCVIQYFTCPHIWV